MSENNLSIFINKIFLYRVSIYLSIPILILSLIGASVTTSQFAKASNAGQVDTSFPIGVAFNSTVVASAIQSDGKILVGGYFSTYNGSTTNGIARLNTDASIDTSFVTGTWFNGSVYALTLQPDGKILVGGGFTSYNDSTANRIIRLNTDGTIDTSFVTGTGFNNGVYTLALQSDGKILIGGNFTSYNGSTTNGIARLNTDGSIDTSFVTGTGFNDIVNTLTIQPDGKILVGGNFIFYNGSTANRIIRLNTDGTIDTSFVTGTGFNGAVNTALLQSDGKVLVGGYFSTYNGSTVNYIVRLNTDGSIDSSFVTGTGFNSAVNTAILQSDGKVLVSGYFSIYNGSTVNYIVRLNTDGSIDTSFVTGTGFNDVINTLALQSDGKILVGGNFSSYNGSNASRIILLNNTGTNSSFFKEAGPNNNTHIIKIQSDHKLIVGGYFSSYNGSTANYIVRLNTDGSIDSSFVTGTGFNYNVYTLELQPDGKILVGGVFTSYNGSTANRIIRLNTDGSIDTSFVTGTGFNGYINTLTLQPDGKILVGGGFTSYNGSTANRIIRLNTDGSIDTSFVTGTGFNGEVHTPTLQPDGKILVGGGFTSYNGSTANRIIRLNTDGTIDTSFVTGTGFNNLVRTIKLRPDGKILVGGSLTSYNGSTANRIIRLNTDGSIDTSFVTGAGFNSTVNTALLQSDGKVLVGGYFSTYNGSTANRIIRLDTDGSIDSSFVTGTGFENIVRTFAFQSDGKILIGGNFTTYNGLSTHGLIRLMGDFAEPPVVSGSRPNPKPIDPQAQTPPSNTQQPFTQTTSLYRLFNKRIQDHFYTTNSAEKDRAIQHFGYRDEGVLGQVSLTSQAGTTPLFRLFNARLKNHFYTTNQPEADSVKKLGYANEGIVGYVSVTTGQPIYRAYKVRSGDHFYTRNLAEFNDALRHGYIAEANIGFVQ